MAAQSNAQSNAPRNAQRNNQNQMVRRIHTCKARKYESCADEFAKHHGFEIIETIDDGNCFFDTLSKAGAELNIPNLSFTHEELRAQLVEYMMNHVEEIAPFFSANNGNSNNDNNGNNSSRNNSFKNHSNDPVTRILQLGEDGNWDNNDGDIISQVTADAFQININIYDVKKQKGRFFINKIQIHKDADHTVDILRINDGHYQLLSKSKSPTSNSSNSNAFANLNSKTDEEIKKSKKYTIPELHKIIMKLGYSDFGKMKKDELISLYRALRINAHGANGTHKKSKSPSLENMMNEHKSLKKIIKDMLIRFKANGHTSHENDALYEDLTLRYNTLTKNIKTRKMRKSP
jgi:OTU-like cysteine protease